MHPVLFTFDGAPVHSYVVATVLGYAIGVISGVYLGWRDGRALRDMLDGAIVVTISAVLGAKLFHTLFEAEGHILDDQGTIAHSLWDLLQVDPWHWARLFEPGYVFYGGVVGGALMGFVFIVRGGFHDPLSAGDYAAPGFALGYVVGRIGCFLAGCCYGTPTDSVFGVVFPPGHGSHGASVHPVQLYDAAFALVGFVALVVLYKKRRFGGELWAATLAIYAPWRFLLELLRADSDRGVWLFGLSTSQLVSLVLFPSTIAVWVYLARTRPRYPFVRPPDGEDAGPASSSPSVTEPPVAEPSRGAQTP